MNEKVQLPFQQGELDLFNTQIAYLIPQAFQ